MRTELLNLTSLSLFHAKYSYSDVAGGGDSLTLGSSRVTAQICLQASSGLASTN